MTQSQKAGMAWLGPTEQYQTLWKVPVPRRPRCGKDLDPVLGLVQHRVPELVTSSSSAQPAMVPLFLTTLCSILWPCVGPHLVNRRRSSDVSCWSDSFPLSEKCPSDTPRCALTDLCLHVTKMEGNYRLDWREGWIIFQLGFMLCEVRCGSGLSFDFKP